jgi:hypothetical protein
MHGENESMKRKNCSSSVIMPNIGNENSFIKVMSEEESDEVTILTSDDLKLDS